MKRIMKGGVSWAELEAELRSLNPAVHLRIGELLRQVVRAQRIIHDREDGLVRRRPRLLKKRRSVRVG